MEPGATLWPARLILHFSRHGAQGKSPGQGFYLAFYERLPTPARRRPKPTISCLPLPMLTARSYLGLRVPPRYPLTQLETRVVAHSLLACTSRSGVSPAQFHQSAQGDCRRGNGRALRSLGRALGLSFILHLLRYVQCESLETRRCWSFRTSSSGKNTRTRPPTCVRRACMLPWPSS